MGAKHYGEQAHVWATLCHDMLHFFLTAPPCLAPGARRISPVRTVHSPPMASGGLGGGCARRSPSLVSVNGASGNV